MVTRPLIKDLRLDSLTVKGFRGMKSLTVPRLGRVTLFAGMNGVGKTTILEAIQIYATRGHPGVIGNILRDRNEYISIVDDQGEDISAPDLGSLFYGRLVSPNSHISIGPDDTSQRMTICVSKSMYEAHSFNFQAEGLQDIDETALKIGIGGQLRDVTMRSFLRLLPLRRSISSRPGIRNDDETLPIIRCESLGPSVLDNDDIARLWYKVALTVDESLAIEALQLVYGQEVSGVAVVGDEGASIRRGGRRPIVKMKGQELPVPLRSLGDGATRIFSTAVALANSQGGFLVIDEAENGIHHSVQRDFWNMVIRTAYENNVQVLATTHSWDCVVGFGEALEDTGYQTGLLSHLSRSGEDILATEYSGDDLQTAIRQGIEVR